MADRLVVFIAAESREFDGILRSVSPRTLDWGLRFSCEAELNGIKAIFTAHGPGMQLAGIAADTIRQRVKPDLLVSTGFCGALDPELNCGDILIGTSIIDLENGRTYAAELPRQSSAHAKAGAVVTSQRVAVSMEDKLRLATTGARVVEMEAGAIAWRAQMWAVPFYCIRAVSDAVAETLPLDFNRMRDASGRFSRPRIAVAAMSRPWSRVPGLIRFARGCRTASASLGGFFADCRF